MSRPTEIETIDLSIEMVQELVDDFPKTKEELSMWDKIEQMDNHCPCCNYYDCSNCPLSQCMSKGFRVWQGFVYHPENNKNEEKARKGIENLLNALKEYLKKLKDGEDEI